MDEDATEEVQSQKNKLKPLQVSILPKLVLPRGRLDVDLDADRLVYVMPKVSSPWKYHEEPMEEEEICQEYERVLAFAENYRREIAAKDFEANQRNRSPTACRRHTSARTLSPLHDSSVEFDSHSHHKQPSFIPTTHDEKQAFWDGFAAYQHSRATKLEQDRQAGRCVFDSNEAAAVNPEILAARHAEWLRRRGTLEDECTENRRIRQEEFEERVRAATSEYRVYLRHLKRQHKAHQEEIRRVLPKIFAAAFAGIVIRTLRSKWKEAFRHHQMLRFASRWRQITQRNLAQAQQATILRHWLCESVKVKTIAHKVFYALRVYISRVILVQSLWRHHVATRIVRRMALAARWQAFINTPPEVEPQPPPVVEQSTKNIKRQSTLTKRDTLKPIEPIRQKTKRLAFPYPPIDPAIREQVLDEAMAKHEAEAKRKFRALEMDMLPHLIQCLQGVYPERNRSQVRALAQQHYLLGSVFHCLERIPGALDKEAHAIDFSVRNVQMLPIFTHAYEIQCPSYFQENSKPHEEINQVIQPKFTDKREKIKK